MRIPLATLLVSVLACSGDPQVASSSFAEALESGASCAELFEIRNQLDPGSPEVEDANQELRNVGCFSSASKRRTLESTVDASAAEDSDATNLNFTVREYRIYRAMVDMPMSVPEAEAHARLAAEYGLSVVEIREVVERVMRALFQRNAYGDAEQEIRHASDWSGESE